jgi:hypothetical protein
MLRTLLIFLLSLVWSSSSPGNSGVSENFRFASSLPTSRLGPSRSLGHGRPRFSETPLLPGPEVKGNVIGLSSNDFATFGLTDAGQIFWTRDSVKWEVIDFNEAYRGYYRPVRFVGIAAGNGSVAVVGTYENTGTPAMFVSSRGNVWTERGLTYSQGDELFELTETPLSVRADLERDEFVITCTDGVLFFVPPCSHCNRKEYHGSD